MNTMRRTVDRRTWVAGCLIILLVWPAVGLGATTAIEFIDGIWLEEDTVAAGTTTRVYVALRNGADADMRGTVTMYVNGDEIGTRDVSALPGRLIETWSDWRPTEAGNYDITAVLHDVAIHYTDRVEPLAEEVVIERSGVSVTTPPEPEPGRANATTATTAVTSADEIAHRRGLEQFIPDSRTKTAFEQFTEQIKVTADRVATHGAAMQERFHSTGTDRVATTTATSTPEADGTGTTTIGATLWESTKHWLVRNVQNAYLGIVRGLQWFFQHPAIVQFFLLLGMLYLVYRTARHFGER